MKTKFRIIPFTNSSNVRNDVIHEPSGTDDLPAIVEQASRGSRVRQTGLKSHCVALVLLRSLLHATEMKWASYYSPGNLIFPDDCLPARSARSTSAGAMSLGNTCPVASESSTVVRKTGDSG